jgi:hypothetical protein
VSATRPRLFSLANRASIPSPCTLNGSSLHVVTNAVVRVCMPFVYVRAITDREKRGWTGDSLAAHSAVSSFFDMRAAWTKWVDDQLFTQSMLAPLGAMSQIVPCIFSGAALCRNDPRKHAGFTPSDSFADVAWGSVLPLLGAYTAKLTGDARFASRAAAGASAYVSLLYAHSDNASTPTAGLLNYSNWRGHLGDWCPAVGQASVSTLLNSHHVILDLDAAVELLELSDPERQLQAGPSKDELLQWAQTARASFLKTFLRNVTVPGTCAVTCGVVPEKQVLHLKCSGDETIAQVTFAGYGIPGPGSCAAGLRSNASCYVNVRSQVEKLCLGQSECSVECKVVPGKRICAGIDVRDPCLGVHKDLSVSIKCSGNATVSNTSSVSPLDDDGAVVGPAFRDLYPPHISRGPQLQTEAASGLAAMDRTSLIDDGLRVKLGNTLVQLVINHNRSSTTNVAITGGIIDMVPLLASRSVNLSSLSLSFFVLCATLRPTLYQSFSNTATQTWRLMCWPPMDLQRTITWQSMAVHCGKTGQTRTAATHLLGATTKPCRQAGKGSGLSTISCA